MNRQRIVTILTLIIVALWVTTAVARIFKDIPQATILDSVMPLVIGYWFASSAAKNGNGVKA